MTKQHEEHRNEGVKDSNNICSFEERKGFTSLRIKDSCRTGKSNEYILLWSYQRNNFPLTVNVNPMIQEFKSRSL